MPRETTALLATKDRSSG